MEPNKAFFYKFLAICILVGMMITACRKLEKPTMTRAHSIGFTPNKRVDSLLLAKNKKSKQKVNSDECVYSITYSWDVQWTSYGQDYYGKQQMYAIYPLYLMQDMLAAGATAVQPETGTTRIFYSGRDLSSNAGTLARQALDETIMHLMLNSIYIYQCGAQTGSACPDGYTPPAGGTSPPTNGSSIDPCAVAKQFTNLLNQALLVTEVKARMQELKDLANSANPAVSSIEHGFIITLDASGFHATAMVDGDAKGIDLPNQGPIVFVVHSHPSGLNGTDSPSSTDILKLGGFNAGLAGSIIIHDNNMFLLSATDLGKYQGFLQKSNAYVDPTTFSGWKDKSDPYVEFDRVSNGFEQLYSSGNPVMAAQLQVMKGFGVKLQQWNNEDSKFHPMDVDAQTNINTGSGSTIGGGSLRYSSIQINSKNCQ